MELLALVQVVARPYCMPTPTSQPGAVRFRASIGPLQITSTGTGQRIFSDPDHRLYVTPNMKPETCKLKLNYTILLG